MESEKRPPSDSATNVDSDTDVERGIAVQMLPENKLAAIESRKQEETAEEALATGDPTIVDWDGPDDPQNPQNWPERQKWTNIALISGMTFVTPLGSSMFAPGIPDIMVQFKERSALLATFVVSIYILGFTFGPLMVAPLSETLGRRPLYIWGNIMFVLFTVGTALSQNMGMMLAFRFLMGLAGSVPLTIGSGSIADLMPIEKRGRAMSAWALGPLLGPCIGPVAGGYLIEASSWRWVFWLITIVAGAFVPASFLFMRETYPPKLLERKAHLLRKQTGNPNLRSALASHQPASNVWAQAIIRPMKLLLFMPIITLMSLYVAVAFGIMYLLITTFSFVYAQKYGFGQGEVGLTFIPGGLGMMIGVIVFGAATDMLVKRRQAAGVELTPEVRLNPWMTMPCAIVLPIGLFLYGWTTEYGVHWIVPMLGVMIFSVGLMGVMMCVQNYLLDTLPKYAASVTAAMTVLRSLAGALLPLGGLEMYNVLGLGWGNSLLAFITLVMVPLPLVFFVFGARIRARSHVQL